MGVDQERRPLPHEGRIDVNADIGESFGRWVLGNDAALLPHVSSVSIACGFHAGDPGVMRDTLRAARAAGVAVGAHPGLPDLQGFGRREMAVTPRDVENLVLYQAGALFGLAAAEGVRLRHVKPHGALYHMAAREPAVAAAVCRAVRALDERLLVYAPPGSRLLDAAAAAGLTTAAEGFVDRAYRPDGTLVARTEPNALIDSPRDAAARAVRLVREGRVRALDGTDLALSVQTLCAHGDADDPGAILREVRAALERAGIRVEAPAGGGPRQPGRGR